MCKQFCEKNGQRFGGTLGCSGNESVFIWSFVHLWNTIYTHRQKLSNSKLVLNIKKMFHTKILEIPVVFSSFDFIRIEY